MSGKLFFAWGAGTLAEDRGAAAKALTDAFVSGPKIFTEGAEMVHFLVEVTDWQDSTELFFMAEQSHDGDKWFPLPAGTALSAAVAGQLRSEVLPFVQSLKKTTSSLISIDFAPTAGIYIRLLASADIIVPTSGAEIRVLASV